MICYCFLRGSSTLYDVISITSIFVCLLLSAMKFEVFTVVFSSVTVYSKGSFDKPVHHVRFVVCTGVCLMAFRGFRYVMNFVHSKYLSSIGSWIVVGETL